MHSPDVNDFIAKPEPPSSPILDFVEFVADAEPLILDTPIEDLKYDYGRPYDVGIGSQGCFAHAMYFVGGFNKRQPDSIMRLLNDNIDKVFESDRKSEPHIRKAYGVENDYWDTSVIIDSLKQCYKEKPFRFERISGDLYSPATYQAGKTYVLDGVLAPKYFCPVDKKWVIQDDADSFHLHDPHWRHSVVLMPKNQTHIVVSRGLPGNQDPIDILYLGEPRWNHQDNKRFLYRIHNAYEIDLPNMLKTPRKDKPKHKRARV